jgi:hypothetical protein
MVGNISEVQIFVNPPIKSVSTLVHIAVPCLGMPSLSVVIQFVVHVVVVCGKTWLITVDGYSPAEDAL